MKFGNTVIIIDHKDIIAQEEGKCKIYAFKSYNQIRWYTYDSTLHEQLHTKRTEELLLIHNDKGTLRIHELTHMTNKYNI